MSHVNQISETGARALIDAGAFSANLDERIQQIQDVEKGHEVVVTHVTSNGDVQEHGPLTTALRRAQPAPAAARGHQKLVRVADLVEFTQRFKAEGTVIFAVRPGAPLGKTPAGFTCVVDYSRDGQNLRWNRFTASVEVMTTREVGLWHKQTYSQEDFARLVDKWADRVVPLGEATASNLLVMASDLEVEEKRITKVTRGAGRLYNATLSDKTETTTKVYPKIKLRLPVLVGRPEQEVEVWVSLSKMDGGYGFEVEVPQLDKLIAAEFDAMSQELADKAGVPVWQGLPPGEMPVG